MLSIKKFLIKILSFFTITQLLSTTAVYPTAEGWYSDYIDVANLENYNLIYVRVVVYGTCVILVFPRLSGMDMYSQYFSEAFYASGTWTYGRMRVDVDWSTNQIGLAAINGSTSSMYLSGVWGTNKLL